MTEVKEANVYATYSKETNTYFIKHRGEPTLKVIRFITDFLGKLFLGNFYGEEGLKALSQKQGVKNKTFLVDIQDSSLEIRVKLNTIAGKYGLTNTRVMNSYTYL